MEINHSGLFIFCHEPSISIRIIRHQCLFIHVYRSNLVFTYFDTTIKLMMSVHKRIVKHLPTCIETNNSMQSNRQNTVETICLTNNTISINKKNLGKNIFLLSSSLKVYLIICGNTKTVVALLDQVVCIRTWKLSNPCRNGKIWLQFWKKKRFYQLEIINNVYKNRKTW